MSTRKKYSPQFRAEALRLVRENPDKPVRIIARELGVPQTVLNNWVRRAGGRASEKDEAPSQAIATEDARRVRELQREVDRLKLELEFAKKAAAFFAKDLK